MKTLIPVLFLTAITAAHGAMFGMSGNGNGAVNFTITEATAGCNTNGIVVTGLADPAGRTVASATLNPAQTTLVQFVVGDSLSSATGTPTVNTFTNPSVNLNASPYTGLTYQYQDPSLGVQAPGNFGTYPGLIADSLINAGKFQKVITMNVSLGGTCSFDWAPPAQIGQGHMTNRVQAACNWMRANGWPMSGPTGNWRFAVLYALGTNDGITGTSPAVFTSSAQAFGTYLRAIGCTGDIFIAISTLYLGAPNVPIQTAQIALATTSPGAAGGYYQGANRDSLTNPAYDSGDGIHLSNAGQAAYAALWSTILQAHY